jgi:sugar phosphate isomerase/epimerase
MKISRSFLPLQSLSHLPLMFFAALLPLSAGWARPLADETKIGGFALGCQAYTFHKFTVLEAIEKTAQAGGKTIEFYPGQPLGGDRKEVKWDHHASTEVIKTVKEHLARHKITAVNYGVVGGKDDKEWRQIFEFARELGLYGITIEAVQDLDTVEKLVKEFDICVGIHEHGRRANQPDYKVWDPAYVLSIGACADTGHWATSNIKPLEALKTLRGRIVSCHLKDRPSIGKQEGDVVFGTGVSDVKAMLDELKGQGFKGNISIEYENNWDHSVPDVAQCIGYVRGWADGRK